MTTHHELDPYPYRLHLKPPTIWTDYRGRRRIHGTTLFRPPKRYFEGQIHPECLVEKDPTWRGYVRPAYAAKRIPIRVRSIGFARWAMRNKFAVAVETPWGERIDDWRTIAKEEEERFGYRLESDTATTAQEDLVIRHG